ncbi:ABC transporter ATP-binding protein [Acuticoccus sediminis]|uniref:ABC transporter ATP-binding protein n=1 Tax=Acuticoccus sediminis TaxID=2184697 RepID=UPI001CFE5634|nr:oligopeptide/dipeptide ABC transporter ATP-binding protein [Acuticoccus sediminis]
MSAPVAPTPLVPSSGAPLVSAKGVSRAYPIRRGLFARTAWLRAVDRVDLDVFPGEVVGVVGESGCGKSTLGRLLLGLARPTGGEVSFAGEPLSARSGAAKRALRSRMQVVFQDPFSSLDPRRSVGAQIADGLRIHQVVPNAQIKAEVARLLALVGLDPAAAARRPHEYSGGQRQRIAIARALATRPDFIVADEPVSALDASIQAQVVNLLADLRAELKLALVFISHDLHVVRHLSDRIAVMYLGRIVEEGPAGDVFSRPAHPYTRALIEATPSMTARATEPPLAGELPDPVQPPSGCTFRTRCPLAEARCAQAEPPLSPVGDKRRAACIKPLTGL